MHDNIQNKSIFFLMSFEKPTTIKRGKKTWCETWCVLFHKDIRFPAGRLRQIWSIWWDHKWIQQKKKYGRWPPPRANLSIKVDHLSSLVQRHHWPFCLQDCKTRRDKSGWDCRERQRVKENKRIYCVRLIVFSKWKWTTEGKKESAVRDFIQRECHNVLRDVAKKSILLDIRQPTEQTQSVLMRRCVMTTALWLFFMLHIQKKSFIS